MMYDAEIKQLDLMALFDLKGPQRAMSEWCGAELPDFPAAPLSYASKDSKKLLWLAPEHWLLMAPLALEQPLSARLNPDQAPDDVSIVRISDTLTFFALAGREITEVMSVASPLDVHRDVFPQNGATYAEFYQIKALILRVADGFRVGVDRSYGPMIADYLSRTMAD